jgi:microsomal dipeptidase-like Zn-dependent dipeptidase
MLLIVQRGMKNVHLAASFLLLGLIPLAAGCGDDALHVERPPAPPNEGIYGFASGCYTMDATAPGSSDTRWLVASMDGAGFGFTATTADAGARFTLRAADLGTYLFYDADAHYLIADANGALARTATLDSDVLLVDDSFESPAEWTLEPSVHDATRFQLRHVATGRYLGKQGLTDGTDAAAVIALYPATGCKEFPEASIDAEGEVMPHSWPDGDLYGIADTHEHMFSNFGFGGGGIFHGSPFHREGVEQALSSCERFHGPEGRLDLVGYAFSGLSSLDADSMLAIFSSGMTPGFDHHPDGWPRFTDWPNAWKRSTHQALYYRWIERAYRAGVRLFVQHATTNEALCNLIVGLGTQIVRYSCNDMVAVDREILETRNLERYIDAQAGGPGKGWFRVVTSPAEAREVIKAGKMAVILGIETSNLFDCFLSPRPGYPKCDEAMVKEKLAHYHELGVRAIFPVHKFDNGFSAGDGDRNVGQLGSFINSGHFSNFVTDCPDVPTVFDHGPVKFGGLNQPRADYSAPAPNDMSHFVDSPLGVLAPFLDDLKEPALEGEYCQNAGLTPLGESLLQELMKRGMIIEVDHMPRRSFARAYELLVANDYPPVGSHGNSNRGVVYQLGGVSKFNFGRCGDPARAGAMGDSLRDRVAEIVANGGYPAIGFGFDLNGFAGAPRPRFGPDETCGDVPQAHPITYPFMSFAGDVEFTQPHLGQRTVDFNTEGMIHLGLLPELIEDARRDGVSDAELEPLFRSAEGYLRMWERAEERGAALRQ